MKKTLRVIEDADMKALPVRRCSIRSKECPEWGTFGVMEDHGMWYDISNGRNSRVLSKDEAARFWERVES